VSFAKPAQSDNFFIFGIHSEIKIADVFLSTFQNNCKVTNYYKRLRIVGFVSRTACYVSGGVLNFQPMQ